VAEGEESVDYPSGHISHLVNLSVPPIIFLNFTPQCASRTRHVRVPRFVRRQR